MKENTVNEPKQEMRTKAQKKRKEWNIKIDSLLCDA